MTYFGDVTLRQQIQKQLSRVEQAQRFSKAVFFDRDRAFQHGTLREQESAIICKLILQNAIILWNYLSLSERIIDTPDPDERRHLVDAIGGGSVITWEHVNLRGEYNFTHTTANDASFDIDRIKALRLN